MKIRSKKHRERQMRIERKIKRNPIYYFCVAVLIFLFLATGMNDKEKQNITEEKQTAVETSEIADNDVHWRFYAIDFWILLIGGGFCCVQIVRERHKAKERLK